MEMNTLVIATRNAHKVGEIRAILGDGFHCLTLNDLPSSPEVIEDAGTFAGNATKKAVVLATWLRDAWTRTEQEETEITEARTLFPPLAPVSTALFLSDGERVGVRGIGGVFHELAQKDRLYVLADDSGLEVDALNGAPGVHSARFAALDTGQPGNSPTAENNAKLLRLLGDLPLDQRTARFRCVLALTPVPRPTGGMKAEACRMQTELFEGTCEGRIDVAPRGRCGFGYDPLFVPRGYEQTFGELSEEVKNRLSHRAGALAKLKYRLAGIVAGPPSR